MLRYSAKFGLYRASFSELNIFGFNSKITFHFSSYGLYQIQHAVY